MGHCNGCGRSAADRLSTKSFNAEDAEGTEDFEILQSGKLVISMTLAGNREIKRISDY